MAGRGASPKDPSQLANSTAAKRGVAQLRVVTSETVPAPKLPTRMPDGGSWPAQTREWWKVWTTSPMTDDYRGEDWQDLLDCAVIHGQLWTGDVKAASELRLRMARHGATREDRARLRITFATADVAESKSKRAASSSGADSKGRRGGLHSA